ncbi:N-acetylmuramoyl-L-alanine amidase [Aliiroseovarius sp. 2305UL8-7]|uniref:N-acetylmuramoyl-L-alanine amidase n=1 Tax=Aliiroseovarius conchicola TaxID=3121637 RepID=UPI0035288E83
MISLDLRRVGASILATTLSGFLAVAAAAQTAAPETSPVPKPNPREPQAANAGLNPSETSTTAASVAASPATRPFASPHALNGLARLAADGVTIKDRWRGVSIDIAMTRTVPWRVFTLNDPQRVVVDFSELDWEGIDVAELLAGSDQFLDIRAGLFRPGWTRLVLTLSTPMIVDKAWMNAGEGGGGDTAVMRLELSQASTAAFSAASGAPDSAVFTGAQARPMPSPKTRQNGVGDVVVVLDPGHGGIDPGAEREGVVEADLMLTFARELKEVLLRSGGFEVVMTRDRDVFVPLEERVTIARRAGADVFLSLHADALAQGRATGATVYTLSDEATDAASKSLAERHDREDLLAGVDLTRHSDEVALVLMDLARTETTPRSEALAEILVEGIYSATGSTYKTPRMQAGFSVLKAPDIPSALIELGFLSSPRDRKLLQDKAWRLRAAEGVRDALQYWSLQDAAKVERLRQ